MKQTVANFYKRQYGVDIDAETEVAILYGTKTGLVELPLAIMNEGELLLSLIRVTRIIYRRQLGKYPL